MTKTHLLPRHKKCPYSEFSWSVFSHIWNEYGDLLYKSSNSVQMRENADQKNSEDFILSVSIKMQDSVIVYITWTNWRVAVCYLILGLSRDNYICQKFPY